MGNANGHLVDFNAEATLMHFHLLRSVGRGSFGKVRIVERKDTKQVFALKYISKKECIRMEALRNVFRERDILESIDHPYVVNLRFSFQDDDYMYMVTDLMLGGDLRFHLLRKPVIEEDEMRIWAAELACGIGYLHSKGIVHRDIKPDNVLMDEHGHVHLTDFNIATNFSATRRLTSESGTYVYMAPEMFTGKGYTHAIDWWALGVIFYEAMYGRRPFEGANTDALKRSIRDDMPKFPSIGRQNKALSVDCIETMMMLLERYPEKRLCCRTEGWRELRRVRFFETIDWRKLERKEIKPVFVPDSERANFDVAYDLEELLMEQEPLEARPRRRTDISQMSREMQLIEKRFKTFDYLLYERYGGLVDERRMCVGEPPSWVKCVNPDDASSLDLDSGIGAGSRGNSEDVLAGGRRRATTTDGARATHRATQSEVTAMLPPNSEPRRFSNLKGLFTRDSPRRMHGKRCERADSAVAAMLSPSAGTFDFSTGRGTESERDWHNVPRSAANLSNQARALIGATPTPSHSPTLTASHGLGIYAPPAAALSRERRSGGSLPLRVDIHTSASRSVSSRLQRTGSDGPVCSDNMLTPLDVDAHRSPVFPLATTATGQPMLKGMAAASDGLAEEVGTPQYLTGHDALATDGIEPDYTGRPSDADKYDSQYGSPTMSRVPCHRKHSTSSILAYQQPLQTPTLTDSVPIERFWPIPMPTPLYPSAVDAPLSSSTTSTHGWAKSVACQAGRPAAAQVPAASSQGYWLSNGNVPLVAHPSPLPATTPDRASTPPTDPQQQQHRSTDSLSSNTSVSESTVTPSTTTSHRRSLSAFLASTFSISSTTSTLDATASVVEAKPAPAKVVKRPVRLDSLCNDSGRPVSLSSITAVDAATLQAMSCGYSGHPQPSPTAGNFCDASHEIHIR